MLNRNNYVLNLGMAKPAQKKNANASANSGSRMVVKPEVDDGTTGGGFINRFIENVESMANGRR